MRVLAAVVLFAAPLAAQAGGADRPQQARRVIETAFATRLQQELGLDAAASERVRTVLTEWGGTRQALEVEERQLRMALQRQLRPGVAADADSVTKLLDRLLANRVGYAQSFQGEMQALAPILTAAQRGQFLLLRDQILQRVRVIQAERAMPSRDLPERRNRP